MPQSLSPGLAPAATAAGRGPAAAAPAVLPALVVLVPALLAAAVVLFAPQAMNDGDTLWHVAAGQWMLDHRQVIRTDVFSYTFAGRPWHAHEWLGEVLMALAYRAAGWSGVAVLGAAAAAAAVGLLGRELVRRLDPVPALAALVVAAGCVAPSLVLRPHLLVLPLLALWTGRLLDARARGRAPALGWAALMTVWANAHASVLFALALIGPFALEAVVEARREPWPALRAWGLFALASTLCALATPFGLGGLLFPIATAGMASLNSIVEWRPPDFSTLQPLEIALLAGLFVIASRGVRLPPLRLLLLLGLLHMSLQHQRHQMLLAVVGVLVLAEAAGGAPAAVPSPAKGMPVVWVGAALGLALAALRLMVPMPLHDGPTLPIAALQSAPAALKAKPVLNDYGMGGYLIFRGVRPFIDGRTDMYGDAFNARYDAAVSSRPALEAVLAEQGVAWTLFQPWSPAVRLMDAEPGWRRLYTGPHAVIHVRR
jgi:hypothetical protein